MTGGGNPGPSEPPSLPGSDNEENTHIMDISKPVGDACREDGTLKDASEMEWPNSPTEYNHAVIEEMFQENGSQSEQHSSLGSDPDETPKVKVRY